jgi:WD40 repeat protein
MVFNLRRHAQPVYSISSNPTGELLATGSLGGHVSVWNLKTGELVRQFEVLFINLTRLSCRLLNCLATAIRLMFHGVTIAVCSALVFLLVTYRCSIPMPGSI